MAKEFFGYFDSVEGDVRQYDAAELAQMLAAAVQNGVSSHNGGGLEVTADGESMNTTVSWGGAVINGYVYVLSDDGSGPYTVTHQPAGTADRIDRVVVRLNMNERKISLAVLEGIPAASAKAPTLTQTSQIWEISLAQVRVNAADVFLSAANVKDERSDERYCGYAVPAWNNNASLEDRFVKDVPIATTQVTQIFV